jgi:hypothetical protein
MQFGMINELKAETNYISVFDVTLFRYSITSPTSLGCNSLFSRQL